MGKWINADYIKAVMKGDRLMQGNCEYELWKQEVDKKVDAMPSIDVMDVVTAYQQGWCDALDASISALNDAKFQLGKEADRKTEPITHDDYIESGNDYLEARCLNCNNAKACKEKHWEGCIYEPKDEKTCETCRHWKFIAKEFQCETTKCQGYEPKTEPQTERYCTNCKHSGVLSVPKCDECQDMNKHEFIEPQTDTEIAKAIVHKMIDDAVIAEDAYPDLRQKMHDAVDEYEPQTDGYMTAEQAEDYRKMLDKAEHKVYGNIEDEPQTDCSWK